MTAAGRALNDILDYLWEDEAADYLEHEASLVRRRHHLFLSLAVLANPATAENMAKGIYEAEARLFEGKAKALHVPWENLPKKIQDRKMAAVVEVFGIRDRLSQNEGDLSECPSTQKDCYQPS